MFIPDIYLIHHKGNYSPYISDFVEIHQINLREVCKTMEVAKIILSSTTHEFNIPTSDYNALAFVSYILFTNIHLLVHLP